MLIKKNNITQLGIRYIWIDLPRELEKAYVIPLADCHVGSTFFDEKKFRGYLDWIRRTDDAFCFFNGDLCNCGLPNTVDSDWWDQVLLTPQEQIDYLVKIVKQYGIVDKILGVIGGSNHPIRARKLTGHDYDKDFAEKLGIVDRYSKDGMMFLIRLGHWTSNPIGKGEGQKPSGSQQIPYTIYATHGWAAGRLAGNSVNAVRELGSVILSDIYVVSHRHLDTISPDLFYVPDYRHAVFNEYPRKYIASGSFLRYGGYALRKGLRPNQTGTQRIRLDGRRKDVHVNT